VLLKFYHKNVYLIKSASKLLGSGFITSIGFVLLSSNRIHYIDIEVVVNLLIFLQFHTIGLTFSKLGFDSISYAAYIENPDFKPNIKKFIINKCLPLSLIIFLFSIYKFGSFIAIIIMINVLIDQYSSLVISQLGFRHKFNTTVFLNFLSYPFYFILIIFLSFFLKLELNHYVIIFFLNLVLKFCFSYYFFSKVEYSGYVEINPKWIMGLQQVLNYLLFKGDAVILSFPLVLMTFLRISEKETVEILFLSRFPELISGITVSLSVLYYPKFYFRNINEFVKKVNKRLILIYFLILLFFMLLYLNFWHHSFALNTFNIIFYFVAGFFVVICNLISFNLIRDNNHKKLIKNLAISVSFGAFYILLCIIFSIKLIFLFVVIQMIIFTYIYFIIPSNEKNR
jgi:hypothetical protein